MMRKRKCPDTTSNRPTKIPRPANHELLSGNKGLPGSLPDIQHAVLSSFYPRVCTLRNYLFTSLPATSRVRRRKLISYGKDDNNTILDTCLVGMLKEPSIAVNESRKIDFATFTQSQQRATGACTGRTQQCCMSEVGHAPHRPIPVRLNVN